MLRAKDIARAKVELAQLEKIAPPHPMIEAMAGNVSDGAPTSTRRRVARFETALLRYPNKMQLIYDYPEALIKAGRPAEASAFAEKQLVALSRRRPAAPDRRSRLCGAEHAAEAARAPGRVLRVGGQSAGAIEQFELAAKAGDGDFYQISVVETPPAQAALRQAELQRNGFGS